MKEDDFFMLAKTMYGLEKVLANELIDLGAKNVKVLNRAVSFVGDKGFMYKANINLRTCLSILKPIATFQAYSKEDLYTKIYTMNWTRYFGLKHTFSTHATTNSETFSHSKYASLVVKDAIVDKFRKKFRKRPDVDPVNADIKIDIHIVKHTCTISLNSSGQSLHKRGYKLDTVVAPINEVLAAGLILLSGWNKVSNFHDPMCGSGTIVIEAALIAQNIPPNILREQFSFKKWKDYDKILFNKIKESSIRKKNHFNGEITGSDIFQKAIRITRKNIEHIGMRNVIKVKNEDFFESSMNKKVFVLFNPPYGQRIPLGINEFYKKIGDTLKRNYVDCTVWLISSDIENMKMIGLKPEEKINLLNGMLKCSFRKYSIYNGSKKKVILT